MMLRSKGVLRGASPAAAQKLVHSNQICTRQFLQPRRRALTLAADKNAHLSRRDLLILAAASQSAIGAAGSAASAAVGSTTALPMEVDKFGVKRLKLRPEGWNTWKWQGHNINWLSAGDTGPVVLLIHGFGASVYHWRYIVPELSKHCRVYAIDCLGFGWSDKPIIDYDGYACWRDEIGDFIKEVIGGDDKVVVVGNSLGGYNALATAAAYPDRVNGVVLLNAAGRFDENPGAVEEETIATPEQQTLWSGLVTNATTAFKKAVVFASFIFTKQPARIKQVLGQVYVDPKNIDDDLVRSIEIPAQNPNASEVFYRIITAKGTPVNRLLDRMNNMPMLLLWGDKDPWCVPARATQIQQYYPVADRIDIDSGHCPHDDTPQLVVGPLVDWVTKLKA